MTLSYIYAAGLRRLNLAADPLTPASRLGLTSVAGLRRLDSNVDAFLGDI